MDQILVKAVSWYDGEWGLSCQLVREAFTSPGLPVADLGRVQPLKR